MHVHMAWSQKFRKSEISLDTRVDSCRRLHFKLEQDSE